jgi:hypothetical protein
MINIDEIERRANAATPGPWTVYENAEPLDYWTVQDADGKDVFDDGSADAEYGQTCSIADREFMRHARTDVPALIARVRELEAAQPTLAVQIQRLAPTWSHETKSWTMRQADDGPYTLWSAAAETIRATMWERDEMRRLVRELEAECERMKTFAAQNFSAMIRQEAEQMRAYGLSYEGVRTVLHEYNDGEISFGKLMDLIRAAARAMAEEQHDQP